MTESTETCPMCHGDGFVQVERAGCRNCGRDIFRIESGDWKHRAPYGPTRGCRSATLSDETDWDDTIPKHWTAEPTQ